MAKDINLTANIKTRLINIAKRGDDIAKALVDGFGNRVVEGLMVGDPTTPSAQITGNGNTTWNINIDKGLFVLDGSLYELAAQADVDVHSGSELLDQGRTVFGWVIACLDGIGGSPQTITVLGTPAAVNAAAPTDSAINTAVGAGIPWVKVARISLERVLDTTVAQTARNNYRNIGLVL